MSLVLPDDVWLEKLKATSAVPTDALQGGVPAAPVDPTAAADVSDFELTGHSKSRTSIANLLSRMLVLPEIATAQLQAAVAEEVGGQTVYLFTIVGALKVPGAAADAAGSGGTT